MTLGDEELFAVLTADQARLVATPADALGTTVPECPEWTVEQLVSHVGRVHRWATKLLLADPPEDSGPRGLALTARGPAILDELATVAAAAVDELRRRSLDEPAYAWGHLRTRRFWLRRLANETAVHRADADSAVGRPMAVDPALASDGIDEYFGEFFPLLGSNPLALADGADARTLHVHCTDVAGEWLLTFSPDGFDVQREHAKGDVAARGAASDLLLALWGRRKPDRPGVEVLGDAALFDQIVAAGNVF
jgi:uncharacterized protein (TIGR03083 family)